MTTECHLMTCRDIPGAQWIARTRADHARWTADVRERFETLTPPNLIEWVEGPRRRTEYDEAEGRVRLIVEGTALVPDVVGHRITSGGER
jgi:hypothetical protein